MNVVMVVLVSGTRNNVEWPAPGELLFEVDPVEAGQLISAGIARADGVDPAETAEDVALVETAESLDARVPRRRSSRVSAP